MLDNLTAGIRTHSLRVKRAAFSPTSLIRSVALPALMSAMLLGVARQARAQTSGWDYDLKKQSAATTGNPGDANYFASTAQRDASGKRWTLVVQSEQGPGGSSPGPANRSFLINGPNSPVTLSWIPHTSDFGSNWTTRLKVDHSSYPHPSGSGYFTFFGFMDHADLGGGPLPVPNQLISSHVVYYTQWAPSASDGSRLIFGAQFWWNGKAHILEINGASANWGDSHPDPAALLVRKDWTPDMEFVLLNGPSWGITVPTGTNHTQFVNWKGILAQGISRGWFSPISGGTMTQSVYTGIEVKNRGVNDLYQTNFRIAVSP